MKCKTVISSIAGILLGICYLAAIVGFDVHVNHHDGEVFVVSLLSRTDCESLHPDDECHCMEHHHGLCHEHDEDCENDICVVSLTGDGFNPVCDFVPATVPLMTVGTPVALESFSGRSFSSFVSGAPPRERLRSLCVLRV